MNFYKASFLSSLFTGFNILSSLIITKITATIIGPEGTAHIGEFGNVVVLLSLFSTASIANGIVKYVAEYKTNPELLRKLINTAFGIILLCSIPISLFILLFYKTLSVWTFNQSNLSSVFLLLAILLIVISMYHLLIGILSGLKEIKWLTWVNIIAAFLNLIITVFLIYQVKIIGALLSNIIFNTLTTLLGCFALWRIGYFKRVYFTPKIDWQLGNKLMRFGFLAAISSLSLMTTMLIIRNYIEHNFSLKDAGLWQGMYSLSDRYLSVITAILGVYYLPKLSETTDSNELIREVRKAFKRIMPMVIILSLSIYLLRDLIIDILLAESFRPMRDLFAFQMTGDVFKVAASLFGNLIIAKAMIRRGLKAEIIFQLTYVLSAIIFLEYFGLVGVSMAFAFSTFILFMVYIYLFRDFVVQMKKSVLPKPWF